ncbi:MAG: hypothetical protein QGH33_00405, partial [Pirellulaceae bacterium]|nr:hypothetical protein [Pirellulaceae bacterium]
GTQANPSDGLRVFFSNLSDPDGDATMSDPAYLPVGDNPFNEAILLRSMLIGANRTFHPEARYYEFPSDLVRDSGTGVLRENILTTSAFSDDPRPLADQFDELRQRYSRLANLITTRSDVFEIIVTVQAGYGSDENLDGLINYRSDEEFTVTAEQKARMIYER